ncbi:hypothetical protein [Paraburkholderia phosphatilytica]|uniref:hypothetical protein n=1 Tax=Paraburkholderia phosphatilytica TaxID=2282883 RepID=UPI000E493B37|nr:hypothetical protein [Paraburkholderia phosphatilytica]
MNQTTRVLTGLALVVMLLLVVAFNWVDLSEAYGDGPPYYSRTVNMDKWENPLPVLLAVDLAAAVIIAGFAVYMRRSSVTMDEAD